MNTQDTRKEITLEQFLESTKNKMCYVDSTDTDVIGVCMRGCCISSSLSELHFMNATGTFAIEEDKINSIYVEDDGEFHVEFGDIFTVTVNIMTEENRKTFIKNLKKTITEAI